MIKLITKDPAKNKQVFCGNIEGDCFYRIVKNEHYMVKENGYGIQTDVLDKLVAYGVKTIFLKTSRGTIMKSKLSDWNSKGKKRDYGNGLQVFLDTKYMEVAK
jgi:hypothetical protein